MSNCAAQILPALLVVSLTFMGLPYMLHTFLMRLHDWLACADSVCCGDLIFALAGRLSRKEHAAFLFSSKFAPQMLLSVGRFEIRHFAGVALPMAVNLIPIASSVAPPRRHMFVWFGKGTCHAGLIRRDKLGTLSEVVALKDWLVGHPEIKTVLIVSSATHLRRVRLCCRDVMPGGVRFRFLPAAGEPWSKRDSWWLDQKNRNVVLAELPKLLLYWIILHCRFGFIPRIISAAVAPLRRGKQLTSLETWS